MKVSIIHNTYQQRRDTVVAAEAELLRSAGHDVRISLVRNDEIRGLSGKVKAFLEAPYSHFGKKLIMKTILEQSPDVIHILNFFRVYLLQLTIRLAGQVWQSFKLYTTIDSYARWRHF